AGVAAQSPPPSRRNPKPYRRRRTRKLNDSLLRSAHLRSVPMDVFGQRHHDQPFLPVGAEEIRRGAVGEGVISLLHPGGSSLDLAIASFPVEVEGLVNSLAAHGPAGGRKNVAQFALAVPALALR